MDGRPRARSQIRRQVARRAAELMYFDGVKEYLRAKRKAAKELEVAVFPNNVEIRDELDRLAEALEGPARLTRLRALRQLALEVMLVLEPYEPRLIGSVLSGHIKATSDVDLHAFCDDHEEIGDLLIEAGYDVEYEVVKTVKGGEPMDFPHYYLAGEPGVVDISVYPADRLKKPQKSSVTHKTMERATIGAVRRLLEGAAEQETARADGVAEDLSA